MRLFVSINFDENTKTHLQNAAGVLKSHSISARISHRENLHLTLAFIGETNRVIAAQSALDCVKAEPFELTLHGYGEFTRPQGSICFAKAEGGTSLSALADSVRNNLIENGFDIDKKPFKPHITLARDFIPSKDFSKNIMESALTKRTVNVSAVSLMKSERINSRLTYTEIYKKVL